MHIYICELHIYIFNRHLHLMLNRHDGSRCYNWMLNYTHNFKNVNVVKSARTLHFSHRCHRVYDDIQDQLKMPLNYEILCSSPMAEFALELDGTENFRRKAQFTVIHQNCISYIHDKLNNFLQISISQIHVIMYRGKLLIEMKTVKTVCPGIS